MKPPRTYVSPETFKQALEQRMKSSSKSGFDFARRRQLLVFDRFLARVVATVGDAATLKGGLVLELRLDRARTTKDVDIRMMGPPDDLLAKLQAAGRLDLGDFMTFEVMPDKDHPEILGDAVHYDGSRFRAECKLAGKPYGQPFGVDVAFGDPIILFRLISTEKVQVRELDGEIHLKPVTESIDYISLLCGSLANNPERSVDNFLARKRADRELEP